MSEREPEEAKGHLLLAERVEEAEACLFAQADRGLPCSFERRERSWLASGIGSSAAHARAFVQVMNAFSSNSAAWMSSSTSPRFWHHGRRFGWVYFSQGLSNNAVAATRHWVRGTETTRVLITAATPKRLEQSGSSARADHLRRLIASGVHVVPMPGADEYTLLIRVIGPLCGFLVALQVAIAAGADLEMPDSARLSALKVAALEAWRTDREQLLAEWREGAALNTMGPLGCCLQNLALKRLEGIYDDPSPIRDLMDYAHGYFQSEHRCKRPQWLLCDAESAGHPLVERFVTMNAAAGIRSRIIASPGQFPESLFFYEMLFNRVLVDGVTQAGIDQVEWPGKGADGPLYDFNDPV